MKKWTMEQVEAARVNEKQLKDCEPWMQEILNECPYAFREFEGHGGWEEDDEQLTNQCDALRIAQNWPPAYQIEDAKPTPAEFSTQYMLGGEPYHPEDDETEMQRLIDGRDEMNDGIKVIRARRRKFKRYVAKQEGAKG